MTVFFLMRFEEQPMYLFGRLGLLSSLTGLIISIYLIVLKCMGNQISQMPLLILGVLLIVIGILFFSLGLLGELAIRLYCHWRKHEQ